MLFLQTQPGRWLQGEKLHSVSQVFRACHGRHKCEVVNHASDGETELVAIHHAGEPSARLLPFGCQYKEIPVLGEDNPSEFRGTLQELIIVPVGSPVLVGRQHINIELS